VMANHEHIEMLVQSVACKWPRRIGGRWEHVLMLYYRDDIWRMATSCTFGMIGMDRATLERSDSRLDKP
jgi:hypothetical protein